MKLHVIANNIKETLNLQKTPDFGFIADNFLVEALRVVGPCFVEHWVDIPLSVRHAFPRSKIYKKTIDKNTLHCDSTIT